MFFRQIPDPHLAQYAYLIGCQRTGEALLVDPERDVDRYLELAAEEGLRIVGVAETHIHADFLSGARELAERLDVTLYLSAAGGPEWQSEWAQGGRYNVRPLRDGDVFTIGGIELQTLHTPGHTPEHVCFLVVDRGAGANEPIGIFTGDFVFAGDLGRPDLLETAAGQSGAKEPAARALFRSVQRFLELPDHLQVWPAHGAGSACGKALGAVPTSTVGYERRFNAAIAAAGRGEDAFVAAILDGQPEPPLYFGRMKRLNNEGVPLLGALPRPRTLTVNALIERARGNGAVVLDARRDRRAFMRGHVQGSLHAPFDKSFPTIAGSYVEPEQVVYLVIDRDRVDHAVRDLVRIGLDRVAGYVTPAALAAYAEAGGPLRSTEVIDFDGVRRRYRQPDVAVLDVRSAVEYGAGHVEGAINVPHTRLAAQLERIPKDKDVLVYCRSGGRAAAASALLERAGRRVIYVDDDVARWTQPAAIPA